MDFDFVLPKLSATMEEAQVLRWLKQVGDPIALGEPLVEIETDKAALEVEATESGILAEVLVQEGSTAEVGEILARIGGGAEKPAPTADRRPPPGPAGAVAPPAAVKTAMPDGVAPPARDGFVAASPSARHHARSLGVDLATVKGTGPRGMITRADIDNAAKKSPDAPAAPAIAPLTTTRRRIAEEVSASRREIPAFWLDRWIDAGNAQKTVSGSSPEAGGDRLTLTDVILSALASVLPHHPAMMQTWVAGDPPASRRSPSVDIGLIVASQDRLLIPVLKDLHGRSLAEISELRRKAVGAAREGRIPAGMSGGCCISLSNLGRSGADRFEAIIQPDQSSIVAIGRLHERVVPRGGGIIVARGFNATLSVDHRIIDGVAAADFLGAFADAMEAGT